MLEINVLREMASLPGRHDPLDVFAILVPDVVPHQGDRLARHHYPLLI